MSRTQITGPQLLDGSITTVDIGDLQVTDSKLSLSGVTAGSFAQVTVNDKGRVTAGSATLPWSQITGAPSILPNLSLTGVISAASGTTLIPFDNTTPLVSEGTQVFSVVCTPSSVDSKLAIQGVVNVDCSSSNRNLIIAAFKGSVCFGAHSLNFITNGRPQVFPFFFADATAGSAFGSSTTYSLRFGVNSSATWYINRMSSAVLNGMMENEVLVWEYI